MLNNTQIQDFINQGYVKIDEAFSPTLAEQARAILWKATGCDPENPATWTQPVVWLGEYGQAPFAQAANTPKLQQAFDQLVGQGRWHPRQSLGSFPVRFPTAEDTGDGGWHVDASFPGEDSDPANYLSWRVNVHSKGRALLMLFLFSDVDEADAPTRIRVGSHKIVAKLLEPLGEAGVSIMQFEVRASDGCKEVLATGAAGTVYLCHPFLVHAAQINRGTQPRFMAQPPLFPAEPLQLERADADAYSPVEIAIREALNQTS